jgi:hypothetical protein
VSRGCSNSMVHIPISLLCRLLAPAIHPTSIGLQGWGVGAGSFHSIGCIWQVCPSLPFVVFAVIPCHLLLAVLMWWYCCHHGLPPAVVIVLPSLCPTFPVIVVVVAIIILSIPSLSQSSLLCHFSSLCSLS